MGFSYLIRIINRDLKRNEPYPFSLIKRIVLILGSKPIVKCFQILIVGVYHY